MRIRTRGPEVLSTDYWSTERGRRGLLYLSSNAGALRLLVPTGLLEEIRGAARGIEEGLVTRGSWRGRDGIEVVFEDGSTSPYVVRMDARQADRLWPEEDDGRRVPLILYERDGLDGVREFGRLQCCLGRQKDLGEPDE